MNNITDENDSQSSSDKGFETVFASTCLDGFKSASDAEARAIVSNCTCNIIMKSDAPKQGDA